ncbi:MAG: hypothetical protein HRO68_10075 [Nitrosopumilus sp.]|nr:hypothetical protein [Nitrosopumilus sp.]
MKIYRRRVINRSKKKNEYGINIPIEVVNTLDLKDGEIKLELYPEYFVIRKLENATKIHSNESKIPVNSDDELI